MGSTCWILKLKKNARPALSELNILTAAHSFWWFEPRAKLRLTILCRCKQTTAFPTVAFAALVHIIEKNMTYARTKSIFDRSYNEKLL